MKYTDNATLVKHMQHNIYVQVHEHALSTCCSLAPRFCCQPETESNRENSNCKIPLNYLYCKHSGMISRKNFKLNI